MQARKRSSGFTIVELLIVIVVIAILAAITIVAYSGVTGRAKATAAQAGVKTASEKVLAYMAMNGDQLPSDLATAGVTNSGGTTFQYSSNSATSPQTFCITATVNDVSYYVDNATHTNPTVGACPGHGANGVAAVTNLASDPRAVSLMSQLGAIRWTNGRGGGSYSLVTGAVDGPLGITTYIRKVMSASANPDNSGFATTPATSSANPAGSGIPVLPGQSYIASAYLRITGGVTTIFTKIWFLDENGNRVVIDEDMNMPVVSGAWTRVWNSSVVPAGATRMVVLFEPKASSGAWAAGDTLDGTGLMVTQGSVLYNYADPTTNSNWVWNGTPNASTSTGPLL